MDNETFGSLVRRTRLEHRKSNKDFSLRKFAAKVGLSPTYLSKAETDEFTPPRAETVIKIAEELGIDKYVNSSVSALLKYVGLNMPMLTMCCQHRCFVRCRSTGKALFMYRLRYAQAQMTGR